MSDKTNKDQLKERLDKMSKYLIDLDTLTGCIRKDQGAFQVAGILLGMDEELKACKELVK